MEETKSALASKTNWVNAIMVASAGAIGAWFPEHKAQILETLVYVGGIINIVLRTFFTSTRLHVKPGAARAAGIILLACAMTACGWKAYERTKASYATANTSYRVMQRVVIELKRQDVITDAQWSQMRPINDKIARIDRVLFSTFVAIEATEDAIEKERLRERLADLLTEYLAAIEEIEALVAEFRKGA